MHYISPDMRGAILLPAGGFLCALAAGLLLRYWQRTGKVLAGPAGLLFAALQPSGETGAGTPRPGGRVLVMDDEEIICKVLLRMLGSLGYETEIAPTGEKALEAWAQALKSARPFAAVIMDLNISGGMGGAEAVLRLKELDPSARVIVSSGYSEDPVMVCCEAYGFDCSLAKPFQLDALEKALLKVTRG